MPKAYKGEPWARTGIDVDNGFKPLYVENRDKKDHIRLLKTLLKEADELYLATDEDREGEAIAWHLIEVLNPGPEMPVKRMVFHEITKDAIQLAVQSPRELDRKMVDAQEARRILDRLYGYEVSPVLWKKVMPQLSAGRVQSVATRIVVERERERMAFIEASYWDVKGTFAAAQGDDQREFSAALNTIDGVRLASGRDFGDDGRLARDDVTVLDEAGAQALVGARRRALRGPRSRDEALPSSSRRTVHHLDLPARGGPQARDECPDGDAGCAGPLRKGLHHLYANRQHHAVGHGTAGRPHDDLGALRQGLPPRRARHYATKSKNAQEAHEAIRPAGDTFRLPAEVAQEVPQSEARAYELIWQRVVASQMTDCTGETVTLKLGATAHDGRDVEFAASGTVIAHMGFREVYEETKVQDRDSEDDADERRLPPLVEGDAARAAGPLEFEGHTTSPPSRFTEASLVKRLEELGVGVRRPTHRSSAPSRTAATSGRRVRRSCRRSPPSRWSTSWRATSPTSSTTPSPPRWRTTSTRSPPVPRRPSRGSAASISVRVKAASRA